MKHLKDFNIVNEGARFNSKSLSLDPGEHLLTDLLKEVTELKNMLELWVQDDWRSVTAKDNGHKEIIPLANWPNHYKK